MTKKTTTIMIAFILMLTLGITAQASMTFSSINTIAGASEWARDSVTEAIGKGYVPADLQGNYTNVITRAEFCRLAVKWVSYATDKSIDTILSEKGLSRNLNAFSDTKDMDILAAYALGITSGTTAPTGTKPGVFSPDGQFTREQAATMIMNTCKAIGVNIDNPPPSGFADMSAADSWAEKGINFVRANGIMNGTATNPPMFSPKDDYTREQSIVTFNNIKHSTLTQMTNTVKPVAESDIASAYLRILQAEGGSAHDPDLKNSADMKGVLNVSITDLNNDNIPELIYSRVHNEIWDVLVYGFKGNECVPLVTIEEIEVMIGAGDFDVYALKDGGIIACGYNGDELDYYNNVQVYRNLAAVPDKTRFERSWSYEEDDWVDYRIDGAIVSKDKYRAEESNLYADATSYLTGAYRDILPGKSDISMTYAEAIALLTR